MGSQRGIYKYLTPGRRRKFFIQLQQDSPILVDVEFLVFYFFIFFVLSFVFAFLNLFVEKSQFLKFEKTEREKGVS